MARLPYLVRQALGRSAYVPATNPDPTNEAARVLEAELVQAKNEVLLSVGVTERSQLSQRETILQHQRILYDDRDSADQLTAYFNVLRLISTTWFSSIRGRILAGMLSVDAPFVMLIASEWRIFAAGGIWAMVSFTAAGVAERLLSSIAIRALLEVQNDIDDGCNCEEDDFDNEVASFANPETAGIGSGAFTCWCDFRSRLLQRLIQFALIPVQISATLRLLRLPEGGSYSDAIKFFVPWNAYFPYRWGWTLSPPLLPIRFTTPNALLSPVVLGLGATTLQAMRIRTQESAWWSIDYRSRIINAPRCPVDPMPESAFEMDSLPFWKRNLYTVRNAIPRLLGWSGRPVSEAVHHSSGTASRFLLQPLYPPKDAPPAPIYRTTNLTMLPATFLQHSLHTHVWKCLEIPFCIIFYRVVASTWLSKNTYGRGSGSFGAGLLSNLRNERWGPLLAKTGLCIAAEFLVDAAIWGGACWLAMRACISRDERFPKRNASNDIGTGGS